MRMRIYTYICVYLRKYLRMYALSPLTHSHHPTQEYLPLTKP